MSGNSRGTPRKYHKGDCAASASRLQAVFVNHPTMPVDIQSHESAWHYLFSRIRKSDDSMTLAEILGLPEWELMIEVSKWAAVDQGYIPNKKRLMQLAALGEQLLSMPMNMRYQEVPESIRGKISWYAAQSVQWWKAMPELAIPERRIRFEDLQA